VAAPETGNCERQIMAYNFGSLIFTSAIKALQEKYGSRRQYVRRESSGLEEYKVGPKEVEFIAERDSFYTATVGEGGWPYIQHRGGTKGFVKVIDDHTIAFADLRGNKQYITTGNLMAEIVSPLSLSTIRGGHASSSSGIRKSSRARMHRHGFQSSITTMA
jgi:hypothetical protein